MMTECHSVRIAVVQSQQLSADSLEIFRSIFMELRDVLLQLVAFVGVEGFVVIASDFDVVLPELPLILADWSDLLDFQENEAHDVNAEDVGEGHAETDKAEGEELDRFVVGILSFFDE